MLDRCTGATMKGRLRGRCSRPMISMRPKSLATPRTKTRTKRKSAISHHFGGSVKAIELLHEHVDDFVDGAVRGVDLDGVVGRGQRAVLAALVERVAFRDRGRHRFVVELGDLLRPASCPRAR